MKQIYTIVIAMAISAFTFAQTSTVTSDFNSTTNVTSGIGWSFSSPSSTWSTGNMDNGEFSHYLVSNAFSTTDLPTNSTISSITVTFTRRATVAGLQDSAVRLRIGSNIIYGTNSNATPNSPATSSWPTTTTSTTYTFNSSFLNTLNVSTIKSSGLSIAVSARNVSGGNNRSAIVSDAISMTITYLTLAPIILTDFTVSRNANNHVDIRFATSSEDNVKNLYVQRSSNGKDFETIFTLQPKGAANVYTKYAVVDRTPLQGANYYRIAEMDKNGRWYYYITKLVNFDGTAQAFSAYYNGGQVVTNISNKPGYYEVSLVDMSGITVTKKQVNMTGKSAQLMLDAPARTGIYVVTLKGQGVSESTRVAIVK